MDNVSKYDYCYGCGICSGVCPKKIIDIELNDNGFYVPIIKEQDKCINCGICLSSCSFNHEQLCVNNDIISCYAGWSRDNQTRASCSSGGIMFEIAKHALKNDYLVVGAKYNVDLSRVEHYIASNMVELEESKGSKYLQSYTAKMIEKLDFNKKYVIVGTPCQIDSFRRVMHEKRKSRNLLLIDFFCHGVPSYKIWDKYLSSRVKDGTSLKKVSWRNKTNGWHDSWRMCIETNSSVIESPLSGGDEFYTLFLSDTCLNKACYKNCKYKHCNSSADIRLGDLWSLEYSKIDDGVSSILTFTEEGESWIKNIDCDLHKVSIDIATEGQMLKSPKYDFISRNLIKLFDFGLNISTVSLLCRCLIKFKNTSYLFCHPKYFYRKIINKTRWRN